MGRVVEGSFAGMDYIQVVDKVADKGCIDKVGHKVTDYRVTGYKDYSFESCFVVAETSLALS